MTQGPILDGPSLCLKQSGSWLTSSSKKYRGTFILRNSLPSYDHFGLRYYGYELASAGIISHGSAAISSNYQKDHSAKFEFSGRWLILLKHLTVRRSEIRSSLYRIPVSLPFSGFTAAEEAEACLLEVAAAGANSFVAPERPCPGYYRSWVSHL